MAVAGVTEAVEEGDLPAQVRGGSTESYLGHHGSSLCRGVRYDGLSSDQVDEIFLTESLQPFKVTP